MLINPNNIEFSSITPPFINIVTKTGTVTISGSSALDSTNFYTTTIALPSGTNFADIYFTNNVTGYKALMNTIASPGAITYAESASGNESAVTFIQFGNSSVTAGIAVNNFVGTTTLTTQTITITVVAYSIPF